MTDQQDPYLVYRQTMRKGEKQNINEESGIIYAVRVRYSKIGLSNNPEAPDLLFVTRIEEYDKHETFTKENVYCIEFSENIYKAEIFPEKEFIKNRQKIKQGRDADFSIEHILPFRVKKQQKLLWRTNNKMEETKHDET